MAIGVGAGAELSYVWTYELGDCFGGCKGAVDLCNEHTESFEGSCVQKLEETDLSVSCDEQEYDVGLIAVPGPHFLIASTQGDQQNCPPAIVFASIEGEKKKVILSPQVMANFPIHHLGTAQLQHILDAEKSADAIAIHDFDLATNSCVHFAGKISRRLGFPETDELATFIIEHALGDPDFEKLAKSYSGGFSYLAAKVAGGEEALKDRLKDIVYSQLRIGDLLTDVVSTE